MKENLILRMHFILTLLKLLRPNGVKFSLLKNYAMRKQLQLSYRRYQQQALLGEQGNTVDFLLTTKRDTKAAKRFFDKSIGRNGKPGLVNIDKSGGNITGIKQYNRNNNRRIKIRQCKYLNNIIEQDHRRIKRITRSMLGFKSFRCAQSTLAGIELMAMINKGQMKKNLVGSLSPAEQFYALAV